MCDELLTTSQYWMHTIYSWAGELMVSADGKVGAFELMTVIEI